MKGFLILIISSILLSCGGNENQVSEDIPTVDTTQVDSVTVDTIVAIQDTTTIYNGLADFFSPQLCKKIRKVNSSFRRYTTNKQFDKVLNDANALLDELRIDIYATKTKFKMDLPQEFGGIETMALMMAVNEYEDSLLPIVIECGAECLEVNFFLDFETMKKNCRQTPSEADDDLVGIMRRVYGVYGNFDYLNRMGWKDWWADDAFAYAFGNNYMYQTFLLIDQFEKKHPEEFVGRIGSMKDKLVPELAIEADAGTMHSRESIINEFSEIKSLDCLNAKQKRLIQSSIDKIESSDDIRFETSDY